METVTFALTPHTSAIIVQRRRYVDAILRSMETKKQLRSRVLARRDALPEEVRARKSAARCARLEQVLAEAQLLGSEAHTQQEQVRARHEVRQRLVVDDALLHRLLHYVTAPQRPHV